MKFKPVRAILCILLVLALSFQVLAVDPANMTDISGHWAQNSIEECLQKGLFLGVSATEFAPDMEMTRGMFVTVLSRLAGINSSDYNSWYLPYLYTDVSASAYYATAVNWATRYGIVYGVGDNRFAPDEPITREQMATIIVRFASIYNYALTPLDATVIDRFTDSGKVSSWAASAVDSMRVTGLMHGYPDGSFAPQDPTTRAMCATVLINLSRSLQPYTNRTVVNPTGVTLSPSSVELRIGDYSYPTATISPSNCTNQKLTWFSTAPSVARVDSDGKITAVSAGNANIYVLTCNGYSKYCAVTVKPDSSIAFAGENYTDKCIRIFGSYVSDWRGYYTGKGTSHVTTIAVRVWQFTDSSHTTKTTKVINLVVHKNIAATVTAIFNEIYNGSEKFPIYTAGGYRPNENGEHTIGTAIDINPTENAEMVYNSSGVLVPTGNWFWAPGENVYSIPANGDVVKAFAKYGFTWGGTWRSKKDYMHFSYFGY